MTKTSKIILATLLGGAAAIGGYFWLNDTEAVVDNEVVFTKAIEFPENDSLSATANDYLDQEVFQINTKKDTVIESRDGILVHIPANSFETNENEVDFMIQSAIKPSDILQAGLSTTSNGNPLETGGMFYLDAFANDERISLNKNLEVQVPATNKQPNMALYQGEKTDSGDINWVKPSPIVNKLTPVPIQSLDFYPPEYENTLDELGYYGKDFRDSLYFSFAFHQDCQESKQAVVGFELLPSELTDGSLLSEDTAYLDTLDTFRTDPELGKKLFNNNCAACHFRDRDMTGPALQGSRERWIENSSEENFYKYIKNSQAVISSGDTYAIDLFEDWNNVVMPAQNVTNEDIDNIFAYVECGLDKESGVNPAAVQSIWNETFEGTNIATKEFEAHMPWIHKNCETEILEIYIQHLDEPLYISDSIAAARTSGAIKTQFLNFYIQKDGKVDQTTFDQDQFFEYYKKQQKVYTEAVKRTQKAYWEDQRQLNRDADQKKQQSADRNEAAKSETLQKEFDQNLEKVAADLGIKKPVPRSNQSTYTVSVTTLGWKNIDREVMLITQNRETGTIEYNGLSSTLTYEDWSAIILNADQYDQLHVYNIPKKLKSYVKIKEESGKYNYSLNADIEYQTLVVGWTAQRISFYQDKQTIAGDHELALKAISHDEFKYAVADQLGDINHMEQEMDYLEFAWQDQTRIDQQEELEALRNQIEYVIFPCRGGSSGVHGGAHDAGHHGTHSGSNLPIQNGVGI
jgi:mono/diheme cytochrome c family protein